MFCRSMWKRWIGQVPCLVVLPGCPGSAEGLHVRAYAATNLGVELEYMRLWHG